MSSPVSTFRPRRMTMPTLPTLNLTDEQQELLVALQEKLRQDRPVLELRDAYYNGEQAMTDLGISMPPELRGLHTVMGWPRLAVDTLHERLDVEGFRLPDSDNADEGMWEIWQANNMDEELPLATLDAMVFGRSYIVVGAADDGSGVPLMTVESPLHMAALWDPRRRRVRAAWQQYEFDGEHEAALFVPGVTVTLRADASGRWELADRDDHGMPFPPVARMANRQRAHDRSGWSEITPEVMSITDAGCRTLLGAEVAREFYAAPQRYALGVTEKAFQDAEGNPKTAWEAYLGRVWALERDEEGNLPQVGQFPAYDPGAYSKLLDMYAEIMSSLTGLPAFYLGKTTDNPASADAIRMSTDRLVQRAKRRQRTFEGAPETAMRLALAFRDGAVPDGATQIETIWRNPEIPTPGATTDAIQKQIAAGYMPAESDVAGEVLGYTPLQRRRIDAERRRAQGTQAMAAVLQRATQQAEPAGAVGGAEQAGRPAPG